MAKAKNIEVKEAEVIAPSQSSGSKKHIVKVGFMDKNNSVYYSAGTELPVSDQFDEARIKRLKELGLI